jgi:DNA (cytosine-5)-methyltransferase 1
MKHLGDITKIKGCNAPVVDCIIGGSPCQDLSVAGKRAGLAGERSGLYMEQIRIIKEMRHKDELRGRTGESIRPRYMVWENVPGAFITNGGKDFAAVLEEAIRVAEPEAPNVPVPEKGWPTSGCFMGDKWSIAWRVLDAQFWGVPQRRRRIALVADFGGQSAPEILFIRKGVSGDIEPGKPKGKEVTGDAENCSGAADCERNCVGLTNRGFFSGSIAETLRAESHGALPMVAYDIDKIILDDQGGQQITVRTDGKSPTIRAEMHGNVPIVMEPAYCIGNGQVDQLGLSEKVGTLNCMHDQQAVLIPAVAHTLRAKASGGFSLNCNQVVRVKHIVRRLTPLECERLQGYPDGWTDIGEWVDSKGKKHKEADSPRYKALGNSIALPPWKWVLKRLCACYERDATMASLFDGIGGFPLIWEQLNGKGSCLWASEIEEFPMAVTKIRFGGED